MKKISLAAMTFGIFLSFAPIVNAQTNDNKPKRDVTTIISDLTPAQKVKIDEITKDFKAKVAVVKGDNSIVEEVKHSKIKELRKHERDDISTVLTDKQKEEVKAYYQQQKANNPSKKGGEEAIKHRLDEMSKELSLTDEQKPKIEAILINYASKIKEVKANTSLTEEQKKSEIQTVRKEEKHQIASILTKEQIEILKQHQAQKRAQKQTIDK